MKIQCPYNPAHSVNFSDSHCEICNRPLTPKHYLRWLRHKWQHQRELMFRIECPNCEYPCNVNQAACPRCKQQLGLRSAGEVVAQSWTKSMEERVSNYTRNLNAKRVRKFQRLFLLVSLAMLGMVTRHVADHLDSWGNFMLMSAVYLVALGILAKWFVSGAALKFIAQHTSRLLKFTLVINYLSLVLLIQTFIGTWQSEALVLGGLFGVSVLAAFLLCQYAWPIAHNLHHLFFEPENDRIGPNDSQGRTIKLD